MSEYSAYSSRTKRRKVRAYAQDILQSIEEEVSQARADTFHATTKDVAKSFEEIPTLADNESNSADSQSTGTCVPEVESNSTDPEGNMVDSDNAYEEDFDHLQQGFEGDHECSDDGLCGKFCDDSQSSLCNDREKLASWAVRFGISHAALSVLLEILRGMNIDVPKDPRTLLMTPRVTDIKHIAGGEFYHFGVENTIVSKVGNSLCSLLDINTLSLHINIDGLPLFGSSTTNLWPILGMIQELPDKEPFVIGLYCGDAKPSSLTEYFHDFIEEMKEVLKKGIEVDFRTFKVVIDAFICDAPARAFVKCIKGHSGYNACERCTQKGVHIGRMTFPEFNAKLRTDVEFDEMADAAHHTDESPLRALGVGFVSLFVLDYMHLVCLGVVRKIIGLWMKGPLKSRLSANMLSVISRNLSTIRQSLPREFSRKPRSLSEFKLWKATEFRQFLLYTGPVVLHGKIPKAMYNNFMLLSVSIRFLASESLCSAYCDYVEKLLVHFVKQFANIFGPEVLIYNIHSLTHIVQDVRRYGALDRISCFPYENTLGILKKMIRRPQNPVAQIMRRLSEKEVCKNNDSRSSSNNICHRKPHISGPVPPQYKAYRQYKQYRGENTFISCSQGDNCFDVNKNIVIVKNVLVSPSGETLIVFQVFEKTEAFFDYPLPSVTLGIRVCRSISDKLQVAPLSDFKNKLVLLPFKQSYVAMPLLHAN